MSQIKTYPEMNETIKDLLRRSEEPMQFYILARIEELEKQISDLTPSPNDPLTLEELRKMDGEIVYCVPLNEWIKPTKTGIAFFGTSVQLKWGEIAHKCGKTWFAYRRKPEDEKNG